MGAFSKFKAAKASGGGYNYLGEGEHLLEILEVKIDHTRKKDEFFAVRAKVVATTSDLAHMQEGRTVDWMTSEDKDAYAGNVKQFVCAVFDLTEAAVDALSEEEFDEMMGLLVGPEQGCVGRLVCATAKDTTTRNGNKFTAVRWSPAPQP